MTSLADWLFTAADRLRTAGIETASADAELLLSHVLECPRGEVRAMALGSAQLPQQKIPELEALLRRRESREPLQHLTGMAPFRHLELMVGPGVFVPRPETEILVDLALGALRAMPSAEPRVADLGTGSGAIALSLAHELITAQVFAVERSDAAAAWAARNIDRWGQGRVQLIVADLATALGEYEGSFDVVVSNPPYIPEHAVPRDPEVHRFDPPQALYGGQDGLAVVRVLIDRAWRLIRPGGQLFIEHGESQARAIHGLLVARGFASPATHRDFTGRDRVTGAVRP